MNFEKQVEKLASIIVNHSISVKKGEFVRIILYGQAMSLADELTKQISLKGAYSLVTLRNNNFLKHAPIDVLKNPIPYLMPLTKLMDSVIYIDDCNDLFELKKVDGNKMNAINIANKKANKIRVNDKKWIIVRYPTQAYAQQAGMSLEEYTYYCFKTMNIDWNKKYNEMKKLSKKLNKTSIVRILGDNTDLTFSVKGRKSKISYGINNIPGGEVFTAPIRESTNGKIFFQVAYYRSKKYENIHLEFKNGKIIKWNVKNDKKSFEKIINIDTNAKFLGELGIGTNKSIKKVIGDILFDEKKGGTIHLALGSAYEENFKENLKKLSPKKRKLLTNDSALHWDLIMKPTKLFFDDKQVKI